MTLTQTFKTMDHYQIKPWKQFKHPMSGFLHLIGALLGIMATAVMSSNALLKNDPWHLASALIFGLSMTLLYTTSSLYHLIHASVKATQRMRQLDHSMIYLFIAGCYTPFCLVAFRETFGLKAAVAVWFLALLGVAIKVFWLESSRWIRIGLYFLLGYFCVFMIQDLWQFLGPSGFAWLMGGGLAYTLGAVVYATKRPDPFPTVFGFHEIWHLFVMLGSACQFWCIYHYVLI